MGKAYKNFWSLNVDEAVAVGMLRSKLKKTIGVFMPTSTQEPDIDLVAMNLATKRVATIQVKGSRAYEPRKSEIKKYGHGSGGWFLFSRQKVMECKADYFLFLIYVLEQNKKKGRRTIEPHIIMIETKELIRRCKKYKQIRKNNRYNFSIWVNPVKKKAFDLESPKLDFSDCLDERGIDKINALLK